MSSSPPSSRRRISFRRLSGWMNSGCASMCAISRSRYAERRKNQFSSSVHTISRDGWIGHRSFLQLRLTLEGLAARAVVALVSIPIQVASVPDIAEPAPGRRAVCRGSVVRMKSSCDMCRRCHDALEPGRELVHQFLGRPALGGCFLRHLLAVLVHPDHEVHVLARQAAEPGDHVGTHLFVSVPDVWVAVGVVDGRRQVVSGHGMMPRSASVIGGLRRASPAKSGRGSYAWPSRSRP